MASVTQRTSHNIIIPKPHYSACFNIGKYSKSTAKTTSTPYLPFHIIETILSELPVKALLRFKAVSKSWNTIISDPLFIQNHHHKSKSQNSQDLFLCNNSRTPLSIEWCLVKLEDEKLEKVETLQGRHDFKHVLCFCDGMLLYKDSRDGYVLWNQSARTEITRLDIPLLVCEHNWYSIWLQYTLGVCQDPTTGDFKVVVVCNEHSAVYSCKNRSWSNIKQHNVVSTSQLGHEPGISTDGAIYWVFRNNKSRSREILYYDPRYNKFKILHKPKDIGDQELIGLVGLGGSLCLYCYGTNRRTIRIWTKGKGIDNNCWEVLIVIPYNVDMSVWPSPWPSPLQPQCILGNKIVIRTNYDCNLVVYSPLENKFEQLKGIRPFSQGLIPCMPAPTIRSTRSKKPRGLHNIMHLLSLNSCF